VIRCSEQPECTDRQILAAVDLSGLEDRDEMLCLTPERPALVDEAPPERLVSMNAFFRI